MKHLAAMNVVNEKSADHYTATPLSTALTEPKYRDGITYTYVSRYHQALFPTRLPAESEQPLTLHSHDVAGPSFHQLPAYLQSILYEHPTNIADGPFQYAHKTSAPFFVWLYENPALASCFDNYMSGYWAGKASWVDAGFYPVDDRLVKGMKPGVEEVLVVDVGGGLGHDLQLLKQKYPHTPGRLVLQDKPEVVRQISAADVGFEKEAHDFFTPQPVRGTCLECLASLPGTCAYGVNRRPCLLPPLRPPRLGRRLRRLHP